MCVFLSLRADKAHLMKRFDASFIEEELFEPRYVQSAFEYPRWPVVTSGNPREIRLMRWGLIPSWIKDLDSALKFRVNTVNARSETIQEKPAFRKAARTGHCLVPADGFFEFREYQGKKYPYFIQIAEDELFALAGLCEEWTDPSTGELIPTFTVLTTVANPLMEIIHNRKKRMPVLLQKEGEGIWLTRESAAFDLLKPFPDEQMKAWPVSRLITSRDPARNSPKVQEPVEYPELPGTNSGQGFLF